MHHSDRGWQPRRSSRDLLERLILRCLAKDLTIVGRQRVTFSPYVLDHESRQLLRGQEVVHLSPKAFDLLSILVSHRPKALSKSDLPERLWPGTFVVEKNLANLVGEIRAAIGDEPSNPRAVLHYSELIPGRSFEQQRVSGTRPLSRSF